MRVIRTLLAAALWTMGGAVSLAAEPAAGMAGFYGSYSMTREASGTGWQPEATPSEGVHWMSAGWMGMVHGFANGVYDRQDGPRGGTMLFSGNMLMAAALRPLGTGTLGFRTMMSLEPATIGRRGYPLILQTGETADGIVPLVDRQHPHDLFMELAVSYSAPLGAHRSVYGYLGLPGEPALGPVTFMHRFSGKEIPEAPLSHHWMDSTHITFGVGTLGFVWQDLKLEGSAFRGREPDQHRWNIETPTIDSYSGRLAYNPTPHWAVQVSGGSLHSPEQLEPEVNLQRMTASVSHQVPWRAGHWGTMLVWGRNKKSGGHGTTDAALLESTLTCANRHTFFGRLERVDKDELFSGGALAGRTFAVAKASAGYLHDVTPGRSVVLGLGGLGSAYVLPSALRQAYGTPWSFLIFLRVK